MKMRTLRSISVVLACASLLVACQNVSFVQKESPANQFKDYRKQQTGAVIGVGESIDKRQMKANALMRLEGSYSLEQVMQNIANTYNVAVRWGNGVRQSGRADLMIADLTFDEVRSYVEDVFKIQIVREGDRRLLVLPAAEEPRVSEFSPGVGISLSQALRGLAQQCDMNLVITENKEKLANTIVTTTLKDVTCLDAFDALLTPQGLSLVDAGDFYTVGGYPQRQWTLNLLEETRDEMQGVSYQSEIGGESEGNSGSNLSGGAIKLVSTSNRNVWDTLESDLQALIDKSCEEGSNQRDLSSSEILPPPTNNYQDPNTGGFGGSLGTMSNYAVNTPQQRSNSDKGSYVCGYVRVNATVGLVQMRAPLGILNEADEIIRRVQDVASRRLLVEARVMAVTKSRGFEQGGKLETSLFSDGYNQANIGYQPGINSISSVISGKLRSLDAAGGFVGWASEDIDAVVRMVEEFGTTYQLMQPTLEVMDRQRAVMIDGRNERFFIRQAETETTDTGVLRNVTAEERVQFVGIQFVVTAQVAEGNQPHTVALQVPITEITRFDKLTQVFDGEEFTDSIPIATTRVIDQKVRIRDGEIKVIGGLNRTLAIDRESGVPLIRGVPVAGKLFNDEDIQYEDVEFIVLLQVRRLY